MNTENKSLRKALTEKYLLSGFSGLSEEEKLTLLLSYSLKDRPAQETANKLISDCGYLNSAVDTDTNSLLDKYSTDEKTAVLLKIIPQLSRIIALDESEDIVLSASYKAKDYFRRYFIGTYSETIAVVCADEKLRIISADTIAAGSAVSVSSSCRRIVELALKNNAPNIFIAHNHPAGSALPSAEDLHSTALICETLRNIGITLIDHIIVSGYSETSIKELTHTDIFGSDSSSSGYIFNSQV